VGSAGRENAGVMEMIQAIPSIAAAVMTAMSRSRVVPPKIFFILSPSIHPTNLELYG
jgi:hypothetical protein